MNGKNRERVRFALRQPRDVVGIVGAHAWNRALSVIDRAGVLRAAHCTVCGWRGVALRTFVERDFRIPFAVCPQCSAHARHRDMADVLRATVQPGAVVVEIAPFAPFAQLLRDKGARYIGVDVSARATDVKGDLRALPFADGTVDVLLCQQVLEHIVDVDACVREIARVLHPFGTALIDVPQGAHATSRRIDPPDHQGHVWDYGDDFADILRRGGLVAQPRPFPSSHHACYYACARLPQ